VNLSLEERHAVLPGVPARCLVHGMPWLRGPLVSTEHAIARLRAWVAGGGLQRPAPDIRKALPLYGDTEVLPAVIVALELMAPPARDYVLQEATILAAGWGTLAWTGGTPLGSRPHVIVISAHARNLAAVSRLMLHEAAHCWLEKPSVPCTSAVDQDALPSLLAALEDGAQLQAQFSARTEHKEALARTLANLWEQTGDHDR